jgi:polyferredoxin
MTTMNDPAKTFRKLGWVFLAIALNIVGIGIGALWMKVGPAALPLLLDPSNAFIWLTTALTFAPALGSFYAARLFRRRA